MTDPPIRKIETSGFSYTDLDWLISKLMECSASTRISVSPGRGTEGNREVEPRTKVILARVNRLVK